MRSRTIKPGFYDNEVLGSMSPLAHLLFPGLWQMADHEGLMEYRPLRIKAKIFPYRDADVASLCDELEAGGLIDRYEVCGCMYLSVIGFLKHQRPHPNEKKIPSIIPKKTHQGTSKDIPSSVQGRTKERSDTEQVPSKDAPNRAGSSGSSVIQDLQDPRDSENMSASPPSIPEKEKPKPDPNCEAILDAWRKATEIRTDWIPQPKMPGNKDTRNLLKLRASEPDFIGMLDRYVELVTALDWAEAKQIVFFLRRQTFDNCLSGEFAPSRKKANNSGQQQSLPVESDPIAVMKSKQQQARLMEIANASKPAGTNLF